MKVICLFHAIGWATAIASVEVHRKTKAAKSKAYKEVRKMFNVLFLAAIHVYDLTYYLNAFFTRFATLPATRTVRGRTNKLR